MLSEQKRTAVISAALDAYAMTDNLKAQVELIQAMTKTDDQVLYVWTEIINNDIRKIRKNLDILRKLTEPKENSK